MIKQNACPEQCLDCKWHIRVKGLTIDNGEAMCKVDESDITRLFERAKSLAMKEAR